MSPSAGSSTCSPRPADPRPADPRPTDPSRPILIPPIPHERIILMNPPHSIDLNSDLGESYGSWVMGNDEAVLDLVSSANIACGFHAGDATVLLKTVVAAKARNVRIGAHIGYNDLTGFGRRAMEYDHEVLVAETIYQIGAIQAAATTVGATVDYVKPHGALYNRIAVDEAQAAAVIEAMKKLNPELPLMVLSGAPIVDQAVSEGLTVIQETFADRAYTSDGRLVSRTQAGAVH